VLSRTAATGCQITDTSSSSQAQTTGYTLYAPHDFTTGENTARKNKAIVDSRLRPQWCFHLANVTEMEEMLDCKLDALIRSFAWEKKRFSCQHKSASIT